jgi:hypothetical protein
VIPGFAKPAAFQPELDFAVATGDKVEKAGASPKARLKAIVDAHLAAGQESERRFGVSEHVAVIRQRAYIAGVETSSTGVTPVLNPVIGTLNTGSVLEVTDAGVSGAGADPDERPDGFSRAVGAIHEEIASDPARAAEDARKGAQGKTAVAKGLVVDELAPKPTPAEVEAAQAALETKKKVDTALTFYASRERDSAAWKKACASVRSSGKLALRLLLEESATKASEDAAFEVLRRATGQLIPDDETAWTTCLSR